MYAAYMTSLLVLFNSVEIHTYVGILNLNLHGLHQIYSFLCILWWMLLALTLRITQ